MKRRYDLDWIRVIATLAVFIYHCLMFFNPWPWHVKNNEIDNGIIPVISLVMSAWLMPVFFAISGVSTYYVLQKGSSKEYIKSRLLRLGIPLVFGVMILTPPQVYIERITHGQFTGTFLTWYPQYFNGFYLDIGGEGNFAFVGLHLWYLFILLIFTFITLPLFKNKFELSRMKVIKPFHLLLLSIPMMILSSTVNVLGLGGWDVFFYLLLFLYGYFFISKESFEAANKKMFKVNMLIAVVTTIPFISLYTTGMYEKGVMLFLFNVVKALNCWSWLLVILHLSATYLSNSNRLLKYGSIASMPFYVLHQPVIVIIGYLIYKSDWGIPFKLFFLLISSFTLIMLIYELVISKISLLRVLFGLKGKYVHIDMRSSSVDTSYKNAKR